MQIIIVDLIIAIVWGGMGIFLILSKGKGWILLAGYNLATEEQRRVYDEKKICIYTGKQFLIVATSFLLATLFDFFFPRIGFGIGMAVMSIILGHYIYIRYRKFDEMFKKE